MAFDIELFRLSFFKASLGFISGEIKFSDCVHLELLNSFENDDSNFSKICLSECKLNLIEEFLVWAINAPSRTDCGAKSPPCRSRLIIYLLINVYYCFKETYTLFVFIVNIFKIPLIFSALLSSIILFSCSKEVYFSGISEISLSEIKENYQKINYSKDDVIEIIGPPLIKENSDNLWVYRTDKKTGVDAFKTTIYNKTLKLKFESNILRSVEEINLD